MAGEVAAGSLGHLDPLHGLILDLLEFTGLDEVRILLGLVQIALDVHGVAGGLGDGQSIVQRDAGGNDAQADDDAPHVVDVMVVGVLEDDALEAGGDAQSDDGGCEVTETLHGEDGVHHAAAVLGGGELGGDDGREGVVATDTDTGLGDKEMSKLVVRGGKERGWTYPMMKRQQMMTPKMLAPGP